MKHLWTAAAATTLIMAGVATAHAHNHKGDHGDKDRNVVQTHDYSGFDGIDVIGVFELDIRAGDDFSVRTEATEKQAKKLKVSLKNDTLMLDRESEKRRNGNNNEGAIKVVVTMPRLVDLDVTGVALGEISAFTGGDIDVEIAGVGELTLSGVCDTLDIDMAGVGEIDARDLVCQDVDADLSGVGELSVHATNSINADAGGVGSIEVYGQPNLRDVDDGFLAKVNIR